jgi:hypothetical protein
MAVSSPVTILTLTPFSFATSIVAFESSRGGSNMGRIPSKDHVAPSSADRATPSARDPFAASDATICSTL